MKNLRSKALCLATSLALTFLFGKTSVVLSSTDRTAYYVVAASDAPSHVKTGADYVCDGTDDQVQIQAAISTVPLVFPSPTANRRVILSEGTFYCSGVVTCSNRNINIQGQGAGVTNLRFANSDGIRINLGVGDEYSATIRDLTLLTTSYRTGTAIDIEGAEDGRHVYIDSVTIKPASSLATWTYGIELKQVTNSVFSNIHIKGSDATYRPVAGISVGERSIDLVFENIDIWHADCGIKICHTYYSGSNKDIEGIRIYNPVLYGVNHGIDWSTPNAQECDLQIHGGHINAEEYGIVCDNIFQVFINGTTIWKKLTAYNFVGIFIYENCRNVSVSNCKLENNHISPDYYDFAIYLAGDRCSVAGNSIENYDVGLWLSSQSSYCTSVGNIIASTTEEIFDAGSNNWIDDSNIEAP